MSGRSLSSARPGKSSKSVRNIIKQGFNKEDQEQLRRVADGAMRGKPQLLFGISERLLFIRVKQPIGVSAVTTVLRHISKLGGGALLWEADNSDKNFAKLLQRFVLAGQIDTDSGEEWRGLQRMKLTTFTAFDKIIYCIFIQYDLKFSITTSFMPEHFGVQHWGQMREHEDKKQEIAKHRKALAKHIVEDASDEEILALMLLHKRLAFKKKHKSEILPKWGDKQLPDKLKKLTAPAFLKHVYAELIVCDTVEKQAVREFDSPLMTFVEQYIGDRIRRQRGLADAAGLTFLSITKKRREVEQEARTPPGTGTSSVKGNLSLG